MLLRVRKILPANDKGNVIELSGQRGVYFSQSTACIQDGRGILLEQLVRGLLEPIVPVIRHVAFTYVKLLQQHIRVYNMALVLLKVDFTRLLVK